LPLKFGSNNAENFRKCQTPKLFAANRTEIATVGYRDLDFQFPNINCKFQWPFIVADVMQPIIGKDFLSKHHLLVDSQKQCLVAGDNSIKTCKASSDCRIGQTLVQSIHVQDYPDALGEILSKHAGVFRKNASTDTVVHPITHHIVTSGPPAFAKPRRLYADKLRIAREHYTKLEYQGIVYRGTSEFASPLHMAPKKDPKDPWRPCGDYRALNKQTLPDRYPMPNIADMMNELRGCKIFSKMDLVNAYHQVPVAIEDQPKTAITTPFGLFIYRRMPFGLRNAAQTFQRLVDTVLQDMPFAKAYMDDILVASANSQEHLKHLSCIFERLQKHGLLIKKEKCEFFKTEVSFIGVHVSQNGIKPLAEKIQAIQEMPQPQKIKDLKRFLGMAGFYHRFIPNFSHIAAPLTDLTKNYKAKANAVVEWSEAPKQAFEKLKQAVGNAVQLAFPEAHAQLELTTDASELAAGAVLHQIVNGEKQPLAFFSRKFTTLESRKSTFDRELLAVYLSLKHFSWLLGTQFTVVTDHKPLLNALTMKAPTPQQTRWLSYISEFNCEIVHVAGADNVVADTLSRSVAAITANFNEALAKGQADDASLQAFFQKAKFQMVETEVDGHKVICDKLLRPFVPTDLRYQVFKDVHNLSHPNKENYCEARQSAQYYAGGCSRALF
jgi:hypothetical protein